MELFDVLEQVRSRAPLIQCITNFVTVNDCANILLAFRQKTRSVPQ